MQIAVMAVDPGVTTGVAGGLFDLRNRSDGMRSLVAGADIEEIRGKGQDYHRIGMAVADLFVDFVDELPRAKEHCLVWEDFILRMPNASGARDGLAPVWVTSAMLAILAERGVQFTGQRQTAAQAKTYATNDRIKAWGLWGVGKPHGTDAARHLATYLATRANAAGRATQP